jgi:hypothetical protein
MKKTGVFFIGLICIVLFGVSTTAGRLGDGLRRSSDSPGELSHANGEGGLRPHAPKSITATFKEA